MNTAKILLLQESTSFCNLYEKELTHHGFILNKACFNEQNIEQILLEQIDLVVIAIEFLDDVLDRQRLDLINQIRWTYNIPFILTGKKRNLKIRFSLYGLLPSAILMTPVRPLQLLVTIERVLNGVFHQRSSLKKPGERNFKIADQIFFIKSNGYYQKVNTVDLEKIVSDGDIIRIYMKNQISPITASLSLKQFLVQFPYPTLLRINKSTIINLIKVEKFNPDYIWIKNNSIPLGEKYKKDFHNRIKVLKTGWKI